MYEGSSEDNAATEEAELVTDKTDIKEKVSSSEESLLEEECESTTVSKTETSTSTGNILDRIIYDPTRERKPYLRQWPPIYPKSSDVSLKNTHQYRASIKTTLLDQMCELRVSSDPNPFRQPAIIATLGPSHSNVDSITDLLEAGANVIRINMAHFDPCHKTVPFQNITEAANIYSLMVDYTVPVCVMMDLQGPEIRTGKIDEKLLKDPAVAKLKLRKGQIVRLSTDKVFEKRCSEKFIYVNYKALPVHIHPGASIYISDGDIKLMVEAVGTLKQFPGSRIDFCTFSDNFHIVCRVEVEGILRNYQQVHIPMLPLPMSHITDSDVENLDFAVKQNVDVVVVPKVRNEKIIYNVKKILEEKEQQGRILVFAKISTFEGLRNINAIIEAADGIVVHRSELALEISRAKLFVAQKELTAKCNKARKPIVCMVQLEPSDSPSSSANACDASIAQCIIDGADSLMLVSETALSPDGPENVSRLCEIIREAEAATMQSPFCHDLANLLNPSIEPPDAIALAAVEISNKIRAAAIVTITTSGRTAQSLSWFRPRCPVIAISRSGRTARQLTLWRSVIPLAYAGPLKNDWFEDCGDRIQYGIAYGKEKDIIKGGDPLVLVTGYRKGAGFTNCLRVVFASLHNGEFVSNPTQYYAAAERKP